MDQHRLSEKREEFTTDLGLGENRAIAARSGDRYLNSSLSAASRTTSSGRRTLISLKIRLRAMPTISPRPSLSSCSAAPMRTRSAANADDQDHGGEDQILRFTVIHLRFNQYADPRGADHPVQQQGNAAHHRHRDDLDSRRQFADAGDTESHDRRAADYPCCRPG